MLLSVIVPLYNEAEGVEMFHHDILLPQVKKFTKNSFEIIYVNDGSRDNTLAHLLKITKGNKHIKVVNLSRNFGKELAITAGMSIATGDATLTMDGDGQHPPELIGEFINKWQGGAQVVVGVRSSNKNEGPIKKWGSKLFYRLSTALSGTEIIPRSTDYRLIDSSVRQEFLKFSERHRITRGLIDWLGFKRDYIEFAAPARIAGRASYSLSQLIRLALNSFISLSLKPLFLFGWIGIIITLLSLLGGLFVVVEQFLLQDPLHLNITGTAMIGIFIAFLTGLILTSQGILAMYVSHIFAQTQGRPLFVIDYSTSIGLEQNTP